jgi:hypothetical protein
MSDLIVVTNANYVKDKVIDLVFSDGMSASVDFQPWIDKFPFFAPLKDNEYFRNFKLDGWTVVWPNGADIAPETLHAIAVGQATSQAT